MESEENKVELITNILYKCKQCRMMIVTESNIKNVKTQNEQILDNFKSINNEGIIIFIKRKKSTQEETPNLLYEVSSTNRIHCKSCKCEIGHCLQISPKIKEHYIIGIISEEKIIVEKIEYRKSVNKRKLPIECNFISENNSLFKKFKLINETLTNYSKDFYRNELFEMGEHLDKLQLKVCSIIQKNEQSEKLIEELNKKFKI